MIDPPSTYAEWTEVLHRFERPENDSGVLAALGRAKFSLSAEMSERLCKRIIAVFDRRVLAVASHLEQDLGRGLDEVSYGNSMTRARRELAPIAAFSAARCWPAELSGVLSKGLDDFVTAVQQKLEENATVYARHDQGARLSIVRRFPLSTGAPPPESKGSRPAEKPKPDAPLPTRRIIL